jgi:CheY-like chemotaxis protein
VSRPKVLLADDHKPMIERLVRFLDQEVEIVAIVSDG